MKCSLIKHYLLIGMLASATMAFADDYHYVNLLVGSRASGLGGAYTALSDDPAGCFYNPAGISFAPSNSLSASVNTFGSETKTYKKAMQTANGGSQSWKQKSSSLLPNFFGVVKKIGANTIGLSYAVTNSTLRRQDQSFYDLGSETNIIKRFEINIDDSDRTYLFGPSYAYRLSDNLSIGTTLYVYYRDLKIIRNQLLLFEQGEHILINQYFTKVEWGLKPSLGMMWEPIDKLSVGLNLSKIYVSSTDTKNQKIVRDTTNADFSDTDRISFTTSDSGKSDDFPLETTLGVAYFLSPSLLFSTDLRYSQDVEGREAVFNFALGAEYYLNEKWAVRGGFWSDFANTPKLSSNETNQPEHVDLFGTSVSLTYFQRQSSISLGYNYGFGNGDAQVVDGNSTIQDVEIGTMSLYLSAGYSF
jgi:long-chain fatty acid transport protein